MEALTAEQVLQKLGSDFATTHPRNRNQAWKDVVMTLMTNLSVLSKAECVSQVKDVINIARDIDESNLGKGGGDKPESDPLDAIGAGWTMPDVKKEEHGAAD